MVTDVRLRAFPVQVTTTGDYAVWVRGMAADASGDSLHLTLDGAEADSAARLTGFVPDSWTWSRLTMSNTNATLSFPTAGEYDVQLLMREDGLRVDKLLLITDTNTIPTGSGPTASAMELITDTVAGGLDTHVITYEYDDLYRLTEAEFSGALSGTYQYEYNAVGSRMVYTVALTNTVVTTYTYDAANQLETARSDDTGVIWHYVVDGNGQRVRQVPGGLTPAAGEVRYTFNQAGEMVRIENHDGSEYVVQADVGYDGLGNRVLGTTMVEGVPVTVTYTLDGFSGMPLMIANPVETTLILYGQYGIGEYRLNASAGEQWHYYLGDGQLSVRQLTDEAGDVTLTRTYAPYGSVLAQAGTGSALFGYAGGQSGANGLWYFGNGYFDPQTGQFLATTGENPFAPLAANVLANPGSLLFGPLMLINWRRRNKKRFHPATLIFFGVVLAVTLTSCFDKDGNTITPTITPTPEGGATITVTAPAGNITITVPPPSSGGATTPEITDTPCPPKETPTETSTPTLEPPPSSTPAPTMPPTPTPTPTRNPYNHKGNNNNIDPGFELSEEEILLVTLAVFVETQNAAHPRNPMVLKTWTYFNKIAIKPGVSVFYALNYGTTNTWISDPNFVVPHTARQGPIPQDDVGKAEWLVNIAQYYLGGSGWIAENFQSLYYDIVLGEVYPNWKAYGTNSDADPSHGALYAVERSVEEANENISTYAEYARINPAFSYVISDPFNNGTIVTIVGNEQCIYQESLCQ